MEKTDLKKFARLVVRKGFDRGITSAIVQAKDYKEYLLLAKDIISQICNLTEEEYTLAKRIIDEYFW